MPSSISNSDRFADVHASCGDSARARMPNLRTQVLLGALMIMVGFVAAMEFRLASRGIRHAVGESEALWVRERVRAGDLGAHALILIGASRMQTDADLDVLRSRTGLDPVQLAIDGSSFVPVLEGLARDPRIRGTVIVSFQDSALAIPESAGNVADQYEELYVQHGRAGSGYDYATIENRLTDQVRNRLLSYADGMRPLTALLTRVLPAVVRPQYAVVLPDRSRLADYSLVDTRAAYYSRVIRELGQNIEFDAGTSYDTVETQLHARIDALPQMPDAVYLQRAAIVSAAAATIQARGGRVVFVVMPTSGLITEMEEKRFPRKLFWDRFAALTHSHTLHFADVPALRRVPVPDGSHIDFRSRAALTNALLDALGDIDFNRATDPR